MITGTILILILVAAIFIIAHDARQRERLVARQRDRYWN